MRVVDNVGAGEFQWIKDDFNNRSAAYPNGEDVTEFMNDHHAQPGQ
jgi:hypothetical protein